MPHSVPSEVTLFVCTNCPHLEEGKARVCDDGMKLFEAVSTAVTESKLNGRLKVAQVRCMGGCDKPCSIAFAGNYRETLLFNEMGLEHISDILTCAAVYVEAPPGHRMTPAERPPSMRDNLLIRVPAVQCSSS